MKTFVRRLVLSAPVWLLLAAIGLGQAYASSAARGDTRPHAPFPIDLLAANYVFWWLATPLVMRLVDRFPIDERQWRTSIAVHAVAACVFALVPEMVRVATMYFIVQPGGRGIWWLYRIQLGNRYGFEVITYVAICAVAAALDLAQRSRDREL